MKQMFKILCGISLVALISVTLVQAYDVNKDLKNLGPNAYDIAVILSGTETVINHYDGYHSGSKIGWFNSVSHGPVSGNTMIHWQNFWDGKDNVINTGQTIHVGWSTADHSSSVKDMYWTDKYGKKIPGSIVFNITSGWTYEQARVYVHWQHDYDVSTPIEIRNVNFAILTYPVELEFLNTENINLNSQMIPIPAGANFMVYPGDVFTLTLPAEVLPNSPVVLRYEVLGTGSDAVSLDYVQFIALEGN
jgi:hypothetical protein